ncbi:uncharacterized protein LOC127445043 [Myxocyprinus asiaticus]|uniref:uncharacterized protein LOC127445043 n=1 Tax=Myxocyprinus asiaticus TaxID=70543 RepID=UPI00222266A6|nr:uncharacterized protein LOC127445043 [Myxocyprinus asiaticus]
MDRTYWISVYLILGHGICVGSSPHSSVIYTSSKVGLPAVLPCTVTSRLESSYTPHIQWQTIHDSVFERMGEKLFQGEDYKGRVDIPEEMLVRGNCSLFLQDVQFSDAGIYESYLVVDESSIKSRIFIQSVQLAVIDHKSIKSVETGGELILDLFTHQAKQVIFQNSNDTSWTVLWKRGKVTNRKHHLTERDDRLLLRRVTASSAGTYKVLDSQGLALSTVKVSVREPMPSREGSFQKNHSPLGEATMNMPPLMLMIFFLTFHSVLLLI